MQPLHQSQLLQNSAEAANNQSDSELDAPPKQVAQAMDRLNQAARVIVDIRLGADRILEAMFVASHPRHTDMPLQLFLREDASMRQHLQDLRLIGAYIRNEIDFICMDQFKEKEFSSTVEMEDAPHGQNRSRDRDQDGDSGGGEENQERSFSEASEDQRPNQTKRRRTLPPQQNLIEVVKGNVDLIPQAVKIWVDRYENSRRLATAELLSMLFEACGAKYSIKEEQLDRDVDDVVIALVHLARAGDDYQFSRKKLISFWNNLIIECQDGPLFDELLFPKCMDYIIALSCTSPRDFRRTATLIGLQLVTSFISVANTLGSQRETTLRKLNAESKKRADGLEFLNKMLSVTNERITTLENMMQNFFTSMFTHRYRDIDPDIRMSCIQSLGIWTSSYPSLFLDDPYLKYLGWVLNDKAAGVRKASLLALGKLYEMDENVSTLGHFTVRFSKRMIQMAADVDIPAAVCAIGLVKQLLRHQLITDDDLGPLYDLHNDEPQEIRLAIGELVYDHLIAKKFNSSPSGLTGHDDSSSKIHIFRMLQLLRRFSKEPILSIYVIDNVWEYMKAMKDWECIISMLLEEPQTWCTNDEDSTNLIRLLFASVRKAVGEKIIPSTDNRKLYHSKAQRKVFEKNRKDITVAMMKNYVQLLHKFSADKANVSSLVEIITFMKYSLKRQEQSFKDAILFIKDAFLMNGEEEALRSCVKAITFCASKIKGKLQDFSREQLKDLEEQLFEKLTSAIQDVKDGKDDSPLLVNLKKLYELQLSKHFPFENMYDELAYMLHNFRNLDEKVICFLLLNIHVDVLRSLRSIVDCETLPEASLSSLISKRGTLFKELSYFLNRVEVSGKYGSQLSLRICAILAEEWCAFEKSKFDSTRLEKLAYCPEDMVGSFWKHCQGILKYSETNRDVAAIAACKLVTSDVVAKDYLGPEIISHLVMHGPSLTEIIKNFITCLRNKEADLSDIYLKSLKRGYQRYASELSCDGGESRVDKRLKMCRELAGQLSGMYIGAARNKHRLEILNVVKGGVEFAFIEAPKQLLFLEVAILPFATRLSVPDMMEIKLNVQERIRQFNTDDDPSGWLPYFTFFKTLKKKCSKNEDLQGGDKEGAAVRRRGRPKKHPETERMRLFDGQSGSDEDGSISGGSDTEDEGDSVDEDAPLIEILRSAKRRRALRGERAENRERSKGR